MAFYEPAPGLARQVATGREWTIVPIAQAAPAEHIERLRAAVWIAIGQLLDEGVCDAEAIELGASVGPRWQTSPIGAFRSNRAEARHRVDEIAARYGTVAPRSLATLYYAARQMELKVPISR